MKSGIEKLSNLTQRIIAGIYGGSIIVFSCIFSGWSYFILFFIICYLSLKEFYQLIETSGVKLKPLFGIIIGLTIYSTIFLIEKGILISSYYYLLFPLLFLLFLIELFLKSEKPFSNIAFTFLGIIYVALPFSLLHFCVFKSGYYNYKIIIGILVILWANDIGGYFAGRLLGKTKLFPSVSPKKTWEGTLGGTVLAILTSIILSYFFYDLNLLSWIILSLIIVVVGSYGDLVESLLKRSLQIKDSSQLIPGHGGFLDRFDGLLLSAPFITAFLKIIL